jgi:hypothetical protein
MADPERLCVVSVGCPRCGTRPALRFSAWLVEWLGAEDPARRVASYKCQRRDCGTIYDIAAGSFRR